MAIEFKKHIDPKPSSGWLLRVRQERGKHIRHF